MLHAMPGFRRHLIAIAACAIASGATITGRLLNQDAFSVQLITPKEELKTCMRSALRESAIVDKGLMPSVQGTLSDQQIADIVAYLGSLKAP